VSLRSGSLIGFSGWLKARAFSGEMMQGIQSGLLAHFAQSLSKITH
jgi:hypothetical protein